MKDSPAAQPRQHILSSYMDLTDETVRRLRAECMDGSPLAGACDIFLDPNREPDENTAMAADHLVEILNQRTRSVRLILTQLTDEDLLDLERDPQTAPSIRWEAPPGKPGTLNEVERVPFGMTLRIQVLSDLHLEFDPDDGEAFTKSVPVAGDVLVLAGDVIPLRGANIVHGALSRFCNRFTDVIYVPGNHEYYRTRPNEAEALLDACARQIPNLHVLNPGVARVRGIRFVGATLWFPHTPEEVLYRKGLNDFRMIGNFLPWVHATHATHLKFLKTLVQPGDVVITHHLPHPLSIAPQHAGSPLNRFFLAEDAAGLVERSGSQLWIHGHTHTPCDYVVGKTRVVCNPRGYPHEMNGFNPSFVVSIDA